MPRLLFFMVLLTGTTVCVPAQFSSSSAPQVDKVLLLENAIYEENIKTVLIYPFAGHSEDVIQPAVVPLSQQIPLLLEFDDLSEQSRDYRVKLIHCNSNWTKSSYHDIDILTEYNEFRILQYDYSFNTRTPYVHYRFFLPRVKVSGNYVAVVYRGSNQNDIVLSRRFSVFSSGVIIQPTLGVSTGVMERMRNQQIEFVLNYGRLDVSDPFQEIKVVIRQNQRWDNAITGLKPTFIRPERSLLEYHHFNLENNFPAGNEFRFFDLRILTANGQNVGEIDLGSTYARAFLLKDKPRTQLAYGNYHDINGQFVINNLDSGPGAGPLEGEYVNVFFFLESLEEIEGDVYLLGGLTDWKLGQANKLTFDPTGGGYAIDLLLKQGWYNYLYLVQNSQEDPYRIEGSHFQTENQYEILVYYQPIFGKGDQLVGYLNIVRE